MQDDGETHLGSGPEPPSARPTTKGSTAAWAVVTSDGPLPGTGAAISFSPQNAALPAASAAAKKVAKGSHQRT